MNELEKSVLKTIVYYDSFDYPLTFKEIETFLFQGPKQDLSGLLETLSRLIKNGLINQADDLYFLKERQELPLIKKERNELAGKKWAKTLKAAKWLRIVPYLRAVFASGSLALRNTEKESDLDVLIVVRYGRIWTTRLLVILLLSFLGVRRTRYERVAPDKICLNHFITEKSLYIPRKSIYTAQLYARLVPIFWDDEKLINEFCEANSWVGEWVKGWPNCINSRFQNPTAIPGFAQEPLMKNDKQIPNSKFLNSIKKIGEKVLDTKLGDWLEAILKKYQLRRINNYHLTYKSGGRVKADDKSLEFHPDSPELKIIERYNQTMLKLGFPELAKEIDSGLKT